MTAVRTRPGWTVWVCPKCGTTITTPRRVSAVSHACPHYAGTRIVDLAPAEVTE